MVGEVSPFDRGAADLGELGRVPAIGAEQRGLDTERPRLTGDQTGVGVVAGDEDRIGA